MFAGIVETTATVRRIGPSPVAGGTGAVRLEIDAGQFLADSPLGSSIAINGVCLTVAERDASRAAFDVIPETLRRTNLAAARVGERVNLERSLRIGDRLDGHFVQGHIDGVGRVIRNGSEAGEWKLWVEIPDNIAPYVVRKGSIALDGVSLTLVDVELGKISVALIPTTLERTVLGERKAGNRINIESDILARLVVDRLAAMTAGGASAESSAKPLTLERLRELGFMA